MVSWGGPSISAEAAFRCAIRANRTTVSTLASDQRATFGDEDFVQSVVEGEDVDVLDAADDADNDSKDD